MISHILTPIGLGYVGLELLVSLLYLRGFALTTFILKRGAEALLRKRACIVGIHQYDNQRKYHKCTGFPNGTKRIMITKRKCIGSCNKKQWKITDGPFWNEEVWHNGDPPQIITFTKI